MRFAYYERPGPARDVLRLGTASTPSPSAGEVLVRILASGVNPSDVKTRAVGGGARIPHRYPLTIPHSDGAGLVEAVGDGVDPARVGERVWLWNGQWGRQHGTAADYIALPSEQAVRLPDRVSTDIGATLGVPWLTAWRAVNHRPIPRPGATMLVAGGAGAVGFYAVQLAKRAGYRVIATVSSAQKASLVRAAGADLTIDYRSEDVVGAVAAATDGRGVDRIVEVDLAGNAPSYVGVLRPGGLVVAYGSRDWSTQLPLRDWLFHGIELAIFIVYALPDDVRRRAIADSRRVLSDPHFKTLIAARFPLERIAEAHELVEGGSALGNVIVDLEGPCADRPE